MPRPRVHQAPDYPSSHGHLLKFSVKKIQVTKGKKRSSQNHRFCHKISSTYIHRDAIKKKRRKAQQHKLAKNPTFVSCVATAKKNIHSKRRKERERKSEGRLPANG
jgi:hypothetical protein